MRSPLPAIAVAAILSAGTALAQAPEGYPAEYKTLVDAAKKEGTVTVYATTDAKAANALIRDFESLYGLKVEYNDLNSTELYNRFISEAAANTGSADLLWSSAPDLQIKLVADGNAVEYASPEIKSLPSWAVFKNQAYGTTYEPMAFVYNKRLVPADDAPKDHAGLTKLLQSKAAAYKGKVTSYDPERSGVGFLMVTQDVGVDAKAWDLFKAMGAADVKLYTSAGAMIEKVASGEHLIAYNIFGSYGLVQSKRNPNLGVVWPSDYTLVATRVAFVPKQAKHPAAGKLFLDYLLSKRGQELIATKAELFAIRADVTGEATLKAVNDKLGDKAKPIPVGPELLTYLEQDKRLAFLKQWQGAMGK